MIYKVYNLRIGETPGQRAASEFQWMVKQAKITLKLLILDWFLKTLRVALRSLRLCVKIQIIILMVCFTQ